MVASEVIRIGRKRMRQEVTGVANGHLRFQMMGELHNQDAVRNRMPTIITTPISDITFRVVFVSQSARKTPVTPVGTASRISGIDERAELRHQTR